MNGLSFGLAFLALVAVGVAAAGGAQALISVGIAPAEVAGGLVTLADVQNVTGTAYWDSFCARGAYCTDPTGVVDYPPTGVLVLTQSTYTGNGVLGHNSSAIVEVSPTTLQNISFLSLPCEPTFPFFPGFGSTVWIPCYDSEAANSTTILGYDPSSRTISNEFNVPILVTSMAGDPADGRILASGFAETGPLYNSDLIEFNATGLTFSTTIPDLDFDLGLSGSSLLAFDSETGDFVFSEANQTAGVLYEINPASDQITRLIGLSLGATAIAMDPQTDQVFVAEASLEASQVLVLNAGTFSTQASLSIPNCYVGLCASPNEIDQVVVDPVHGDAYLLSDIGTIALNLSSLSEAGLDVAGGDGPVATAAYAPASDRIFETYAIAGLNQPGLMVQLQHGEILEVTTVLWLPTALGSLMLAAVVAAVLALLVYRHRSPGRRP